MKLVAFAKVVLVMSLVALGMGCGDDTEAAVPPAPAAQESKVVAEAPSPAPKVATAPVARRRSTEIDHLSPRRSKSEVEALVERELRREDPVRVVSASVVRRRGVDGVALEIENRSDKPIVAFSGFVYGFTALDEPEQIALGARFTQFQSPEGLRIEPGETVTQWWESFYRLEATAAVAEIVRVRFEDDTLWVRE